MKVLEKINLVYICGTGFSGSTLLDLILGSHSKIESVGEICYYTETMRRNGICTCLNKVYDCHYWQEVNQRFQWYLSKINKSWEEVNIIPIDINFKNFWKLESDLSSNFIKNYGLDNYYLFRSILDVTGKEIIVDSSKSLKRFICLKSSEYFNLKMIYLIRECCGFLHTKKMMKYGKVVKAIIKDENGNCDFEIKKRFFDGPIKASLYWYLVNLFILNFFKKNNFKDVILVRYKDLCLNPIKELLHICKFLEIPFEERMLNFGDFSHHNIGGNAMRISKKAKYTIKYDDVWKKALSKYEFIICNFFNKRLNF